MTILRFAPSPTGRIHIGNARTAILNWLMALKTGGQFVLRYDDTDTARSTQEFADGIAADLDWLGIRPSRVEWQSKRFARYDEIAEKLRLACIGSPVVLAGDGEELSLTVSVSVGATCLEGARADEIHLLLQAADIALYEAKHNGRNGVAARQAER